METALPGYVAGTPARTRLTALQTLSSNGLASASRVSVRHQTREWAAHAGITWFRTGDLTPGELTRTPDPDSYAG